MLEFARSSHFYLVSFPPYSCPKAPFLLYIVCNVSHFKMQVVYNTQERQQTALNVANHEPLKSFFSSLSCRRSHSETETLH